MITALQLETPKSARICLNAHSSGARDCSTPADEQSVWHLISGDQADTSDQEEEEE